MRTSSMTPPTLFAVAVVLLAVPASGAAQSDLTVELGASQVGTALNVVGDDARFVIAGLRGSHHDSGGSGIFGSVLVGRALGSTEGNFVSGLLEGRVMGHWAARLEAGLDARLLASEAKTPFPYQAVGVEGGPWLRWVDAELSVEVSGLAGVGRSEIELWRVQDGPTRRFEHQLRRVGGNAEILFGPATSRFGLVAGWHDTPRGDYRSVGARAVFAGAWGIIELRADRWVTPFDREVTAGLTFLVPVGEAWTLRGFLGRTEPDPLTLAQPGSTGGGMLLGRSLLPVDEADGESGVHRIVGEGATGSRVRFAVTPPAGTRRVQLLGDFTLWEPVDMRREGDTWHVEVDVSDGVHHFGFLVDDEWYLPDDAPDIVPDEWGRQSATLVIEGAS